MNRLHKMPCDIARLTDRQLYELVYHPRNKDGQIEIVSVEIPTPEQLEEADPPTPEDQQDALCRLKMMLHQPRYIGFVFQNKHGLAQNRQSSSRGPLSCGGTFDRREPRTE